MSDDILEGLRPLFEQAEREGLWFYCSYQQLWFSPKELKAQHAKGKFIWGADNWRLRQPQEMVDAAINSVNQAQSEVSRIQQRIAEDSP